MFAGEFSFGSDSIFCTLIKMASTDRIGLQRSSRYSCPLAHFPKEYEFVKLIHSGTVQDGYTNRTVLIY